VHQPETELQQPAEAIITRLVQLLARARTEPRVIVAALRALGSLCVGLGGSFNVQPVPYWPRTSLCKIDRADREPVWGRIRVGTGLPVVEILSVIRSRATRGDAAARGFVWAQGTMY